MDSKENVAMGDSKEDLFHKISSTNERLMREAADYLAAMSYSPGEETSCSCETRKTDNTASSSEDSLSARLKVPPLPGAGDNTHGVETQRKGRSSKKNLISIDENGGGENANNPSSSDGQYEYFNDFDPNIQSPGASQYDDDSLVAMAKRMDAASIISDPSLICGTKEKTSLLAALPGMKKLMGQRKPPPPPPPPPRNVRVNKQATVPPRPTPAGNSQQLNQQSRMSPPNAELLSISSSSIASNNKRDSITLSSGSPSSSYKENIEFVPDNNNNFSQINNGKNHESFMSLVDSTASTFEHNDRQGEGMMSEQSSLVTQAEVTEALKALTNNKGRRKSSSPKVTSEERKAATRSGRRSKKKKSSSRKRQPSSSRSPGNDNGYLPAAYTAEENAAAADKGHKVRRRRRSRSRRRTKKKKSPSKKQQKQKKQDNAAEDSDDETMVGIGFNTRIRHNPSNKNKDHNKPKEEEGEESSMRGIGFNTRIRGDNSKVIVASSKADGEKEGLLAKQQIQTQKLQSRVCKDKKSHRSSSDERRMDEQGETSEIDDDIRVDESSDGQTEFFYETASSSENDSSDDDDDGHADHSVYDSDEQTQFFYESTDDDDEFYTDSDSSEEEMETVGTSVADAVKDLNNKRTVVKVKSLFGIRSG